MSKNLIIGIDPGTTVGYAILSLSGEIVGLGSGKNFDLDTLVAKIAEYGKPIIVGTDKAKSPSFVSDTATKFGARLVFPEQDLLIAEKRKLASEQRHSNDHEMDALASAFFAFKKTEPLLGRIRRFAESQKKPELFERLAELVIKKEISIKSAFEFLTAPETETKKIMQQVIEKKEIKENDYLKLYDELVKSKSEISLLKLQNKKLLNLARRIKSKINGIKKERPKIPIEPLVAPLKGELSKIKKELVEAEKKNKEFESALANIHDFVIAKKLPNLGWHNYLELSKTLGIRKGDVLLVKDPNEISERTIAELAGKIELVLCEKPTKKILPFVLIPSKELIAKESRKLAFISRKKLDNARKDKELLKDIVEEYQSQRLG